MGKNLRIKERISTKNYAIPYQKASQTVGMLFFIIISKILENSNNIDILVLRRLMKKLLDNFNFRKILWHNYDWNKDLNCVKY